MNLNEKRLFVTVPSREEKLVEHAHRIERNAEETAKRTGQAVTYTAEEPAVLSERAALASKYQSLFNLPSTPKLMVRALVPVGESTGRASAGYIDENGCHTVPEWKIQPITFYSKPDAPPVASPLVSTVTEQDPF